LISLEVDGAARLVVCGFSDRVGSSDWLSVSNGGGFSDRVGSSNWLSISDGGGLSDRVGSSNWLSVSNSDRRHSDCLGISHGSFSAWSSNRGSIGNWDSDGSSYRAGANHSFCKSRSDRIGGTRCSDGRDYFACVGNRRCSNGLVSGRSLNGCDGVSGGLCNSWAVGGRWWVARSCTWHGSSKDSRGKKTVDSRANKHFGQLRLEEQTKILMIVELEVRLKKSNESV